MILSGHPSKITKHHQKFARPQSTPQQSAQSPSCWHLSLHGWLVHDASSAGGSGMKRPVVAHLFGRGCGLHTPLAQQFSQQWPAVDLLVTLGLHMKGSKDSNLGRP
jgi:hypothetical protein